MKYLKVYKYLSGLLIILVLLAFYFIQKIENNIFLSESVGSSIILYSSLTTTQNKNDRIISKNLNSNEQLSVFNNEKFSNHKKEIFLSPDRKLIAVTVEIYGMHGSIQTFIIDTSGNIIADSHPGSFISWSPDSKKILAYRSGMEDDAGRKIYLLDINNNYYDLNLPKGVISADFSPNQDDIVYSLTDNTSDSSDIWMRDANGKDKLLFKGENDIFAWLRWSPNGNKIAFLKSEIKANGPEESRQLWVVDSNGSNSKKVADKVLWGYPPMWSPTGDRLIFAVQENAGEKTIIIDEEILESNIWEYSVLENTIQQVTKFSKKKVLQPNYSSDGKTIIFISNQSDYDEIWVERDNNQIQITNDREKKRYPIIP